MRVTPQSLPIPQTQAPSAPSSSPCPENAERKASEAESEWLRWPYPTTRKPWCKSNRVPLCLGYPVHRSLPPTRRSSSDGSLVPGKVWNKPLNPHANLSLLRATRIVPTVTIYYVFGAYLQWYGSYLQWYRDLRGPPLYSGLGDCPNNLIASELRRIPLPRTSVNRALSASLWAALSCAEGALC